MCHCGQLLFLSSNDRPVQSLDLAASKRRSSAILERTRAMKFTQKSLRAVCSTKRGQLATACFTFYRNSKFQLMLSGVIMPNTSQFDLVCCKCRLIVFSFQFIRNRMYLYT